MLARPDTAVAIWFTSLTTSIDQVERSRYRAGSDSWEAISSPSRTKRMGQVQTWPIRAYRRN